MAEPRLMGQAGSIHDAEESDLDGEHEVDDMEFDEATGEEPDGNTTDAEGSDVDAEGEEVDDDEEIEPVGAVKVATRQRASSEEEEDDENDLDAAIDSESDAKTSASVSEDPDSSSSESEAENEWQAEESEDDGQKAGVVDPNLCIYCNEDEDNDPAEEYEEYLACSVCGDNAHSACAREANTLSSDDDAKEWRCTACIQHGLEVDKQSPQSSTRNRLDSVPKLARDLLPSHRGEHPGGHSVFNDLILPDDPMDGSRSLRKRKASDEDDLPAPKQTNSKRRRASETSRSEIEVEAPVERAASSPRTRRRVSKAAETDDAHDSGTEPEENKRTTRSRGSRPQQRKDKRPLVWLEESVGLSLIVCFHLNNEKMQKILMSKPKKKERERDRTRDRTRDRNRDRSRKTQAARAASPESSHYPAIQTHYAAPFYGFADKEVDETKNKPYGGILSEADADTSKTYPTTADRRRFEDARQKAEEEWKKKQAALYGSQEPIKPSKQAGPPSKIKCINFGGWEIDTWHAAPYPEEYSKNKVLYICEFCLKYMNSDYVAWRHKLKCPAKHPPGDEIYRDGKYSFFEVDGRKNPVYCQNLCLLAKLFLGSKTLYYDVEPFLFYVMTENDNYGCHFVGYFSKEKRPSSLNNVSCILVLPIHMRKGYGQYLIEFSYLLTRVERKTGSPEKPLSDMGLVSYRKYWRLVLCQELLHQKGPISITAISDRTGMTPDDIVSALEGLRALVRDPVTKTYALRLDYGYFRQYIEKCNANDNPKVNDECLVWTPYVMGRISQYEDGPALHAVQPREEPEEEEQIAPEEGVQQTELAAKMNGDVSFSQQGSIAVGEEADPGTPGLPQEDTAGSPAPGTPQANGSMFALSTSHPSSAPSIPVTRYEIYPPIPGMPATRRRPGRPFGSRRRTSTPQRTRSTPLGIATAPVPKLQLSPSKNGSGKASPSMNGVHTPSGSINLRRTRSKLGESVINGLDEDMSITTNGRRSGTRSATDSPNNAKNQKGKGKLAVQQLDEDLDADGESDDDLDADGELDIDAEGEDDDTIMANA